MGPRPHWSRKASTRCPPLTGPRRCWLSGWPQSGYCAQPQRALLWAGHRHRVCRAVVGGDSHCVRDRPYDGKRAGTAPGAVPHRKERTYVISASVRIAAPPEVVFAYFTGPQLFVTWTGQRADLDARPGGTFAFDFEGTAAPGQLREPHSPRPPTRPRAFPPGGVGGLPGRARRRRSPITVTEA